MQESVPQLQETFDEIDRKGLSDPEFNVVDFQVIGLYTSAVDVVGMESSALVSALE